MSLYRFRDSTRRQRKTKYNTRSGAKRTPLRALCDPIKPPPIFYGPSPRPPSYESDDDEAFWRIPAQVIAELGPSSHRTPTPPPIRNRTPTPPVPDTPCSSDILSTPVALVAPAHWAPPGPATAAVKIEEDTVDPVHRNLTPVRPVRARKPPARYSLVEIL